ncbi:hypothetical protein PC110_g1829 [Phytophthora cactorum]|uniref:WRKY19-like zinc finger domain-containing protein n=2 Tax=Phytophthora cactorum TaxID=29920 RepID=A0A329T1K5_9STRA|nr:hypothetical protein PC110_g1829 [Phytophthora cactorum]
MGQGARGHGRGVGGERCSTAGCSNKAQGSGRCRTHTGTLGQCSLSGCEKQAQYKGLCVAHGGRRVCTHPDCSKTVTSKGLCGDHGGGRRKPSGSKRPSVKQDKAVLSTSSGMSMMSLLLNEWPQEVDNGVRVSPPYTGHVQDDKALTEAAINLGLPRNLGHSESPPVPLIGGSTWTVSDAKFSTDSVAIATSTGLAQEKQKSAPMPSTWHGDENVIKLEPLVSATLVMPTMSTTLPQETQGRERMPHSNAPAWPGNENVIKMEPLVSAASVMPATVTTSTASPQETQSSARMPCSDAPAWPGDENVIKLEPLMSAASVMPTSNQSGGSMMSLLLGAWSQHTLDAVKTEESSAQWDSSNTTDMPVRTRKRALCTHDGCTKIAQSQGLCVTHGGKRCTQSGCIKSAQYQGLCTTHGGSRACTHPGCTKTIRSAGRCFEHGGGKRCSQSDCTKQAQSNGQCSAHRNK